MLLDDDVDLIYDTFFRKDIEELQATRKITLAMFQKGSLDTSKLVSKLAQKAHQVNPCGIFVNYRHRSPNHYNPIDSVIHVSVHRGAVDYAVEDFDGDIDKTASYIQYSDTKKAQVFLNEFTEERIKGSIHHELTHWVDDTLHNQHIAKRSERAQETGLGLSQKGLPINADYMEIQAQIHNIYQLKRQNEGVWDLLSFDQMIHKSPPLMAVDSQLQSDIHTRWKRALKTRMHREGLLGASMV